MSREIKKIILVLLIVCFILIGVLGLYFVIDERYNKDESSSDESTEKPPAKYPENQLIINEFEPNPKGPDSVNEYVELYNPTNQTLWVMDWAIQNNKGDRHSLSSTISPYRYVVWFISGPWLDNSAERLILLNENRVIIDSTPILTDISDNHYTWSRIPNAMDTDSDSDWAFVHGTRGRSNNESQGRLIINEIELNPTGSDSDNEWVELFNPTNNSINFTSWYLLNKDDNGLSLAGSIDPGGYEIILLSGEWLNNSKEKVILMNPSSFEVDSTLVKTDSYDDDNTWQRIPDGADTDSDSDWVFQSSTKGYSNYG